MTSVKSTGIIQRSREVHERPPSRGWMYLSGDKVWVADPGILVTEVAEVTRHAAPCPPRPDTVYPGRSLVSLAASDLGTCVAACEARATCRGVTWTRRGATCELTAWAGRRLAAPGRGAVTVSLSCSQSGLPAVLQSNNSKWLSSLSTISCLQPTWCWWRRYARCPPWCCCWPQSSFSPTSPHTHTPSRASNT